MSVTNSLQLLRESCSAFAMLRRSREAIRRTSLSRLRETLELAGVIPFWKQRLETAGLNAPRALGEEELLRRFRELPLLTKSDLREAGADAMAGGRVHPSWHTSRSSGSTGEPFRTYFDRRAWLLMKHVVKLRARVACGVRPHHKLALVDAFGPQERESGPLEKAGRFRAISALQPAVDVARELAGYQPDGVYGLPTALLEAARAARISGFSPASPNWLFTSGELLSPGLREELEEAYHSRVFDIYGATETKEVAWECIAGSMHVNADVVMLEVLDDEGTSLPPGEEGQLAATVLVNGAMPLLRYMPGDRGSLLSGTCSCGCLLPLFGVVTGREADVLNVSGRRVAPYVLTCAMEEVRGIRRYQVVQTTEEAVRALAELDGTRDSDDVESSIHSALEEPLGEARITVEFVDGFHSEGKFHVVRGLGEGGYEQDNG